jgi:branched-chain amino acid transport system substrate-binding protein
MKKILSAVALCLCLLSCKKDTSDDQVTIQVGGLLSLTGNWSTLGLTSQEAMNLALKEVNNEMENTGSRYRFATTFFDTKLDTTLVQAGMREAHRNGVRYIIGPQSSAEVDAVRNFAEANGMLVVSQGSTAGVLALPGDAIFRFCPSDAAEGSAMARTIYASGRRALITVARNDAGNKGLQESVGTTFQSLGGTVDQIPPYAPTITNFSALLADVKSRIQQHSAHVGAEKVGVYLACFDGVKDIFRQAAADPVLSSVHWYGGDGITQSNVLVSDAVAASFATAVQLFAPSFGLPQQAHPALGAVSAAIKNKTGLEPDAYALAAYDALFVIARTVAAFPEPPQDFTKVKETFQREATHFFGLTGPLYLNAAGDRSVGSFDYWGVEKENGSYTWKKVGKAL